MAREAISPSASIGSDLTSSLRSKKLLRKQIDPARYNGASLIGLKGIVIKSHGSANVIGFARAIEEAMMQIKQNVLQKIMAWEK